MRFFSGFCFQNEEELFASLPCMQGAYTLSGFSYGAILAFQEAFQSTRANHRIQTLNLISPAFFQTQKQSFLKAQILSFKKDSQSYIKRFLLACGNPPKQYFKQGSLQELEELLLFEWKKEDLRFLQERGVQINVFLGGKDLIIPSLEAQKFFAPFGITYFYRDLNHCLMSDHL